MKIGILSDIHGNRYALTEVLSQAKKLSVERLIIAGDFVDYYYSPDKVLNLLSTWKVDAVLGNHEEYLFEVKKNPEKLLSYQSKYGHGLTQALALLTDSHWNYLNSLKMTNEIEIDSQKFFICHGSPTSTHEYIYPDADPEVLKALVKDLTPGTIMISGHTHYHFIAHVDGRVFLNPGSVGQSRQQGGMASWVVFDTSTKGFQHQLTPYDVGPLMDEVTQFDPGHPYLSTILTRSAK